MTYEQARLCLSEKAKLLSSDPEGELWKDGRKLWMIHEDETGWNCTRVGG